jgi:hypothetical protein
LHGLLKIIAPEVGVLVASKQTKEQLMIAAFALLFAWRGSYPLGIIKGALTRSCLMMIGEVGASLADLSTKQIAPKRPLKSLRFLVQPEVISATAAY